MKCENYKCDKEHDGSYGSGRFCSQSCANSKPHTQETKDKISKTLGGKGNKRIKIENCLNCGKELNKQLKYCSNQCQNDHQYKQYIERWKNGEVDGFLKNGVNISSHIRRYLWEKYNGKCSRCGWNTPNPFIKKVILEIEHMDGDSTNNDEDNLDLICPNCHSLTETYKALNKGNGNKQRLKLFKLI